MWLIISYLILISIHLFSDALLKYLCPAPVKTNPNPNPADTSTSNIL